MSTMEDWNAERDRHDSVPASEPELCSKTGSVLAELSVFQKKLEIFYVFSCLKMLATNLNKRHLPARYNPWIATLGFLHEGN